MTSFCMTLAQVAIASGESHRFSPGHNAVWVQTGAIRLGDSTYSAGDGVYCTDASATSTGGAEVLVFSISKSPSTGRGITLLTSEFDCATEVVLRLDQVSFPPGARAYRHVHPGPGIRCLVAGELEIKSDHSTQVMTPVSAWFEDTTSPVQATAGTDPASFVRAMVLPIEYDGKPTLQLLSAEDEGKPRLQTNTRFFDQRLTLDLD